ncbi:MAG: response regulator transcription factor [Verrucomicrobiota bacterium]
MLESEKKIRILLVDDHPLTREGIRACLADVPHIEIVGEAADGQEAVECARRFLPDVIVMDVNMPRLNGIAATTLILRENREARVLFLTMHDHIDYIVEIIRSGARGCLSKAEPSEHLLRAIEKIAAGETCFGISETLRYLRRYHATPPCEIATPLHALTTREREVVQLVGEGLTNRQISLRLNVALRTVETYRERLMRKLDVHDAAGLRSYAAASDCLAELGPNGPPIGN